MKLPRDIVYEFSKELFRMHDDAFQLDYSCSFAPPLPLVRHEMKRPLMQETEGLIELYSSKKEELLEQFGLLGGKKHGRYLLFFPSGLKASERWYIDDVLWGRAIDYFPDGKKKASFGYKKGKLHGPYCVWHETGKPLLEAMYDDGLPEGVFHVKNEEGLVIRTTHFSKGKRNGTDAGFAEDGYLLFLDKWSMGERKKSPLNDYLEQYLLGSA